MNRVYIMNTPDSFGETEERLAGFVSDERREKIGRIRTVQDRVNCLYSELFVRMTAGRLLGRQPEEFTFGVGEHGKPYIKLFEDFHYNVSHTGNTLALAVCEREVGIDAETVGDIRQTVTDRFFTADERAYVGRDRERFFEIWTKKEAYAKCLGIGLSVFKTGPFSVLDKNAAENFKTYRIGGVTLSMYTEKPVGDFAPETVCCDMGKYFY